MASGRKLSVVQLPTVPEPTVGGPQRAPGLVQARPFGSVLEEHACPKVLGAETAKVTPNNNPKAQKEKIRFIAVLMGTVSARRINLRNHNTCNARGQSFHSGKKGSTPGSFRKSSKQRTYNIRKMEEYTEDWKWSVIPPPPCFLQRVCKWLIANRLRILVAQKSGQPYER